MKLSQSPAFKKFISDFTLGFSDGLTVPFALTAGLSSLGKTDTVISGGLAELCAGSISMGIGGYLAARDDVSCQRSCPQDDADDEEAREILSYDSNSDSGSMLGHAEKLQVRAEELVRRHLEPLNLPNSTLLSVLNDLLVEQAGIQHTVQRLGSNEEHVSPPSHPFSPITSGVSISLGYAVGGSIPLIPYFFASTVGMGLRWSFGLCLMTLFAFGAGKSWIMNNKKSTRYICLFEGAQMLILGAIAAGAAVACVNLVGES